MVDFQEALYAYLQLLRGIFCIQIKNHENNVHAFPVKPKFLLETFFIKSIFLIYFIDLLMVLYLYQKVQNWLREFSYGNKLNYHTIYNGVKLNKFKK